MSNLPKSGGWLNTIKVVFGFIELALAFKFLSNADLVLQAHWLNREVFLAIWIAIFALLSYYLFGKLRLPHDPENTPISVGRMLAGLLTLSFTIYMIPGLWGAPLQLVSAFAPPQTYSESPAGLTNTTTKTPPKLPNGATIGPNNLIVFEDYNLGMAYAKTVNKPILLDFTGRACQNCRLMESNVWADPEVLDLLQNQVVLISLYGDERTQLPKNEQYTSPETQSKITTVGQKWTEFQRQKYSSNARPFYVLINTNQQKLNQPIGYTPNIQEYVSWLKSGIHKK
jgi:thiol:disulfide interchange protein DsbD